MHSFSIFHVLIFHFPFFHCPFSPPHSRALPPTELEASMVPAWLAIDIASDLVLLLDLLVHSFVMVYQESSSTIVLETRSMYIFRR